MLGSRFDLFQTLDTIAANRSSKREDATLLDHSANELEQGIMAAVRLVYEKRTMSGIPCPVCETQMDVSAEHPLPEFGGLDVNVRELNCPTCGMLARRVFHPAIGYDNKIAR